MTAATTSRDHAAENVLTAALTYGTPALELLLDEGLRPADLPTARHQAIYRAVLHLHDNDAPIDQLAVRALVENAAQACKGPWRDTLDAQASVDQLNGPIPDLGNLRSYAQIIRIEAEHDQRGRLLTAAVDAHHRRDTDALNRALADLDQVGHRAAGDITTAEQLGSDFIDWYSATNTGAIPTPFTGLDDLLAGGFIPGGTTVLAAWPGMGKSIVVDMCAAHTTSTGKTACVYVNEMVVATRTARTLARLTGVPFRSIVRKQLDQEQLNKVIDAAGRLPFPVKECAGWSADEIARHVRRNRWDLWAVDLVTRIPARDTADWDQISGRLTDAAVQTGSHGILVCQLNLERAKQVVKPAPVGRDLRNTGAWYADATNVIFVHREQEEIKDNLGLPTGVAQTLPDGHLRVEKSRNDEPGVLEVTFNPTRMEFELLSNYRLESVA
jgi:replicative DNA helicase